MLIDLQVLMSVHISNVALPYRLTILKYPKEFSSHFTLQLLNMNISQLFSSQPLTPPPSSLSADDLAFHFTRKTEAIKINYVILSSNLLACFHPYPYVHCSSSYNVLSHFFLKMNSGATPICYILPFISIINLFLSMAPFLSQYQHAVTSSPLKKRP